MRVEVLVSLLSHLLTSISLATALTCSESSDTAGNFSTNSTYGKNRDLLLASLPANVSANGGFFAATIGQDSNKVYALGLCSASRAFTSEKCYNCLNSTIQDLIAKCPNQKAAYLWSQGDPCLVRYADRSFLGILELEPTETVCNDKDLKLNLTQFYSVWERLMDSVKRKASMGSSSLKYATGETYYTSFQGIFAQMQCTPDLSQKDCDSCLRQSLSAYVKVCYGRQGGYCRKPNCQFGWASLPFYESNATTTAPFSSPLPPPESGSPPPQQVNSTNTITKDGGGISSLKIVAIVVPTVILVVLGLLASVVLLNRRKKTKQDDQNDSSYHEKFLQFDFHAVRVATENFSDSNMLGKGGFGTVYKGKLEDGQEVAVKRLSGNSSQGQQEFKNEVLLLSKLQHRNLVRLLGFTWEQKERILIYEFVPKSSLNNFIFHPSKRVLLNWEHRYKIIVGIARGIHYLQEDSRLRIIHRDLKADNILLDADLNPKISDFGMAKLFRYDQTHTDTSRVVGTFGYMAPEYVKHGHFSIKSDVYSFGVLVLEIISGKKISQFFDAEAGSLPAYVWKNWKEGTSLNVIDPILGDGSRSEMMKCIHLGLLCVQEDVARRPTMATIVLTLSKCSYSLPEPSKPGFYQDSSLAMGESSLQNDNTNAVASDDSKTETIQFTRNEVTISDMVPR